MNIDTSSLNFDGFDDDFCDFDPSDFGLSAKTSFAASSAQDADLISAVTKYQSKDKKKESAFGANRIGIPAVFGGGLDFDIDSPPDLAGEIASLMKKGANRPLFGGAYGLAAIQAIAMASGCALGYKGCKLSLITLTLAPSASGKDRPQKIIKSLLGASKIRVSGDIRSDKDIIRTVFDEAGKGSYCIDEAQKVFGLSAKDSDFQNSITSYIMEIATTSRLDLSKLHADEYVSKAQAEKRRIKKELDAKKQELEEAEYGGGYTKEEEQALRLDADRLELLIKDQDKRIDAAMHGIKNPTINLMALSTPIKLASIVTKDSIESGFLGRSLIAHCGSYVQKINKELIDDYDRISQELDKKELILQTEISAIYEFMQEKRPVTATQEAQAMLSEIADFYDQDEYRNHDSMSALFCRLLERVHSVASILAIGNIANTGAIVITSDHVKYALSVCLSSIDCLESELKVNSADAGLRSDKTDAIKQSIIKQLRTTKDDAEDGWRYRSRVKDKVKRAKFYQEAVKAEGGIDIFDAVVSALVAEGKVQASECGKKIRVAK